MNRLIIFILVAAACVFADAATAQDTNLLRTQIGMFEARTGAIIVKGFGQAGSLPLGAAQVFVRSKQTVDVNSGEKINGLSFEIEGGQFGREWILIDEDEVDALLNAVDYLSKINYDSTSLPSFEAAYTTKAGLRIIAIGVRRDGGVVNYLQGAEYPRIPVSSVQMTQLYNLIAQSRKNLDALKAGK